MPSKSRRKQKSKRKSKRKKSKRKTVENKVRNYSALYLKKMQMRNAVGELDPSLWNGDKGEGKLLKGRVYRAMHDLKVYRAYNSFNPSSPLGHWWTFAPIKGSISNYRVHEDICISWSPLDRMISGTLKKNTLIAYGGGQSAQCDKYTFFPAQPLFKQVYIPNPVRDVVDLQHPKVALFKWVNAIYDKDNRFALQKY